MTERIWLADLSADQLKQWLEPPRTEARFAILERIDSIDFPAPGEVIAPEQWVRGRIFGPAFELRWERRGEAYRARWTGEGAPGAPFAEWTKIGEVEQSDAESYLWGSDEMRIGRRLEYRAMPDGEGRPCLLRRELRRRDGVLVAVRWAGMKWEAER